LNKRNQNIKNRICLSKKYQIAIDIFKKYGHMHCIDAAKLINKEFIKNNLKKMTEQYSIKFIYHLFKINLINKIKINGKFLYFIK